MASEFTVRVYGGPGYGDLLLASLRDGHPVYFKLGLEGILFRRFEKDYEVWKILYIRIVQVRRQDMGWGNDTKITDRWTIEGELYLGQDALGFVVRGDYRTDMRSGEFTITERSPQGGDLRKYSGELDKSEWLCPADSVFALKLLEQVRKRHN